MIYVLDRKTWHFDPTWSGPNNPFQYVDLEYFITKFLFVNEPTTVNVVNEDNRASLEFVDELLKNNPDIKVFACNLDAFVNKASLLLYDEEICKKYPNVFFIFFYHELDFTILLNSKVEQLNNIAYVLNSFNTSDMMSLTDKVFPYYIINSYLQKNYNLLNDLYQSQYSLRKSKKYNFLNGIHKPHRFAAYQLIKKHNMLEDGFFSYLDYPNFLEQESHRKETAEWLNISLEEFENELKTTKIPYLLETYEPTPQPGIFYTPFLVPPIYSWQSYISITSETNYVESSNIVSLSEKSFKAFAGFNIPLIYGQPNIVDYLKELGFDMFDDLFDNTPTNNKADTLAKLDRNLQVINNMSFEELHNFYLNNYERIKHNFYHLTKRMKNFHFSKIKQSYEKLQHTR